MFERSHMDETRFGIYNGVRAIHSTKAGDMKATHHDLTQWVP